MGFLRENKGKIVLLVIVIIAMLVVYFYRFPVTPEETMSNVTMETGSGSSSMSLVEVGDGAVASNRIVISDNVVTNMERKGSAVIYAADNYYVVDNGDVLKPGSTLKLDEKGEYHFYSYKDPSKSVTVTIS